MASNYIYNAVWEFDRLFRMKSLIFLVSNRGHPYDCELWCFNICVKTKLSQTLKPFKITTKCYWAAETADNCSKSNCSTGRPWTATSKPADWHKFEFALFRNYLLSNMTWRWQIPNIVDQYSYYRGCIKIKSKSLLVIGQLFSEKKNFWLFINNG